MTKVVTKVIHDTCYYCKRVVSNAYPDGHELMLTRDHVLATSRNFKSKSPKNVICCLQCNRRKGALTPEELKILGWLGHGHLIPDVGGDVKGLSKLINIYKDSFHQLPLSKKLKLLFNM